MSETTQDYIDSLVMQVGALEAQFYKLQAIITQLQEQRDTYKALYEACRD